jgi:hypothetical protein
MVETFFDNLAHKINLACGATLPIVARWCAYNGDPKPDVAFVAPDDLSPPFKLRALFYGPSAWHVGVVFVVGESTDLPGGFMAAQVRIEVDAPAELAPEIDAAVRAALSADTN